MNNHPPYENTTDKPAAAAVFGCVIAGGKSQRMNGSDKPFMTRENSLLIDIALNHLCKADITTCAISSSSKLKSRFEEFLKTRSSNISVIDVLEDEPQFTNKGPLAGLFTALRWAYKINPHSLVYTCPVDTPLLSTEIPARLLNSFYQNNCDCVIAAQGDKLHPIIGVWQSSSYKTLAEFLNTSQKYSFHAWLSHIDSNVVDFSFLDPSTFLNINTPSDLLDPI